MDSAGSVVAQPSVADGQLQACDRAPRPTFPDANDGGQPRRDGAPGERQEYGDAVTSAYLALDRLACARRRANDLGCGRDQVSAGPTGHQLELRAPRAERDPEFLGNNSARGDHRQYGCVDAGAVRKSDIARQPEEILRLVQLRSLLLRRRKDPVPHFSARLIYDRSQTLI